MTMSRTLLFSDGAELPIRSCGETAVSLWIEAETDIYTAVSLFSDPARLGLLVDHTVSGAEELRRVEFVGYTALKCLQADGTKVLVCLAKE